MKSKLHIAFTMAMLFTAILATTGLATLTPKAVSGVDSVTGAIWTTDPRGDRVNGNLYTNAKSVYLCGGPHKPGSAGLPDGIYYFQVTDPPGKNLLSTDALSKRKFEAQNGYIYSIDGGSHKWNEDTTRGYGIVVQLWPFTYTPSIGGVYKVWVTRVEHYMEGQGSFGFVSSLSKTDNFKVKLDEAAKYFELWVSPCISTPLEVEFYVDYAVDGDGDAGTFDPILPWITGQLTYDRTECGFAVFRYETSFALGTYIYWQFYVTNSHTWTSGICGPELISEEGMVNSEVLFAISGHKYNYPDNVGMGGWMIELYKDGEKVASTMTDSDGYYWFMGLGVGNYVVSEETKSNEGWAPHGPTSYEFTADTNEACDYTFDFYNYKMLRITDTSDQRNELPYFSVVFTPSNEAPGMYKLSSTNPGSFYTNLAKFGEPGTSIRIEIDMPPDKEHADFDTPNFMLHHTYIGSTSLVDIHVYAGRLDSNCWVPDWSKDITNQFSISASLDGKHAVVEGAVPDTGEVFVTVHIDFQIEGALTWEQVQMFSGFEYTFGSTVYASIYGVTRGLRVG